MSQPKSVSSSECHNPIGKLIRRIARNLVAALLLGAALFSTGNANAAQLALGWVDNSGGTANFNVERKTGITGTYVRTATTGIGITSYTDTAVVAGTTYCYRVTAVNAAGTSDYSNEACGSPAAGFDVSVTTAGSGTVVSTPAGITCPGTCVQSFAAGKVVTLTATPAAGSSFSAWSGGGCAGTDPCVLAGNTPVTVTAAFALTGTAPTPTGSVTLVVTGDPATGPYAVEAQTTLPGALTVNFFVDGSFVHQATDAKYCLFGGGAACGTGTLGAGTHVIKAQVLAQGSPTVLAETQISVTEGSAPPQTGAVTLVVTGDPATGPYAVEAQTTLPGALTVNFFVDGSFVHQETVAKYCLFGGGSACGTGTLGTGAHVITAQVVAPGTTTVLAQTQITVTAGPVVLVVTGNPATESYAVEAQTSLPGALTVNFLVDGNFFHQEETAKYCLFGGDGPCGTGTLGAGTHVIKVQVFQQDGSPVAETQITVTE